MWTTVVIHHLLALIWLEKLWWETPFACLWIELLLQSVGLMPSLSQTLDWRRFVLIAEAASLILVALELSQKLAAFFSCFFFFLSHSDMVVHVNVILHIIWSGVGEWSGTSFWVLHLHFSSFFMFINIKESEISLNSVLSVPCHGRSWHGSSSVPYDWKWLIHVEKVPLLGVADEKRVLCFASCICVRNTWETVMGPVLSSSVPMLVYLQIWRIERDPKRSMSLFPSSEPFESKWVVNFSHCHFLSQGDHTRLQTRLSSREEKKSVWCLALCGGGLRKIGWEVFGIL